MFYTPSTYQEQLPKRVRINKRFYARFKSEKDYFLTTINGIASDSERTRYASLMLNRIMFLYFMQHKGLLDNDPNYLPKHLMITKNSDLNFYRRFLLPLFHERLSKPGRSSEHHTLHGNVPFLNIDLFKDHPLERNNPTIQIANEAFDRLFSFFDAYRWRLDDPQSQNSTVVTPDILGYIFEKQDNQKQMGAFYTRENIASYIATNAIIPYLFDAVEKKCGSSFHPAATIWQLLHTHPQRYIYPYFKNGMELALPPEIAQGIDDIDQRTTWKHPAPAVYALPGETWRDVVARRRRYEEIYTKLASGEIHCINDLITYNLDLSQFAQDVIVNCEELNLLNAFYESLVRLTILDPTCGSGAFLFAALSILEPLYAACLDRLDHLRLSSEPHANHRYHILKTILTFNLYGVDVSQEAVEICKLSLYLKLLNHVEQPEALEPLPAIDQHICTGNTLIGCTREIDIDISPIPETSPGIGDQAFHWFAAFPSIMQNGGFNVIIGNPPYVEYEKASQIYKLTGYKTLSTGNLYAMTIERCVSLLAPGGRFGMIVPSSATCTDGYIPLQKILLEQSALYISSYSDQRGKLFDIPHPRLCIILFQKGSVSPGVYSTSYIKLGRELRDYLFQRLEYIEVTDLVKPGIIPRYSSAVERSIHAKLHSQTHRLGDYVRRAGSHKVCYTRKLSWFVQVTPFIPQIFDGQGSLRNPSELKTLSFSTPAHAAIAFVALNSHLFYWFLTTGSDCRNLNMREVLGFPLDIDTIPTTLQQTLQKFALELAQDLQRHSELIPMHYHDLGQLTIQCIFPGKSISILDEIDRVLARHYSFTDEELDFILHFDRQFRVG